MKIFLLSILILSALTNLCSGGRSPGFFRSRYCISHSRNLGGGARRIIELCFKFRGGNAPPALPVADPMQYVLTELVDKAFGKTKTLYKNIVCNK